NKNIPALDNARGTSDFKTERELILKYSKDWAERSSRELEVSYEITGEENIPKNGPIMVYANHQGLADILALLYLFRNHFQLGFVAKEEWRKFKPLAKAIKYTRSIFLSRNNPKAALGAISECTDLLSKGFSIAIFPEGTRSKGHEMGEFKAGAFKFAEKGKVPILPITLDGSYKMYEEKKSFRYNQTIKIKVHPLVHFEKMDRIQRKNASIEIENTIRSSL
ncbi:MAG: lysophospholipid acyltransferase family protein, partial [Alphaproteobacteria bacterium]|nr:lysophospholipid acyltransferase family protein [Alphaproteobacteria bacterium]